MAKNGTNTGTGGFNLDDKANSYDAVPEGEPGLGPIAQRAPYDKGDIDVDTRAKDLSEPTRVRLGQYLSDSTKPNYIPVGKVSNNRVTTQRDNDGLTPRRTYNNDNAYTKSGDQDLLSQSTNSVPYLEKGKPKADFNGNNFLDREAKTKSYVTSIAANSRFARADDRYAFGKNTGDTVSEVYVTDYKPDELNKLAYVLADDPQSPVVRADYMENIGVLLSLRGTGEILAGGDNIDPSSNSQQLGAWLPSPAQTAAVKIDKDRLNPRNVLDDLKKKDVTRTTKISINDDSWGVLNNVHEPYSGITVVGMRALVLGLKVGFTALIGSIGLIGQKRDNIAGPNRKNGLEFDHEDSGMIGKFLQLPATTFPLNKCVSAGLQLFLGEDPNVEDLGAALTNAAAGEFRAIDNADLGRKAVALRNIVRTAAVITQRIRELLSSGNATTAVTESIELINVIRTSKLFAAMRIFGRMGDMWLLRNSTKTRAQKIQEFLVGATDEAPPQPTNLSIKNRANYMPPSGKTVAQTFGGKSAWSVSNSPSMYLVPATLSSFAESMASNGVHMLKHTAPKNTLNEIIEDKITADKVKEFEERLESEYIPFYFHDLRTNEIVSFHAFLTNLSESYQANYSSDEGFGRIDPVRTYKNTTRKIDISFIIVPTNNKIGNNDGGALDDYSVFWYKLNKLTTLLYPQYTMGKRIQDSANNPTYSLIQPFSQLIGASPMIRLRIGDLITSNYSKFALMRLFGFGEVAGTGQNATPNKLNGKNIEYKNKGENAQPDFNVSKRVDPEVEVARDKIELISPSIKGLPNDKKSKVTKFVAKFTRSRQGPTGLKIKFEIDENKTKALLGNDPAVATQLTDIINANGGTDIQYGVLGDNDPNGAAVINSLELSADEKSKIQQQINASNAENTANIAAITEVENFFSDSGNESNAIVRAFKETGGRGLAGFIESMSFDWFSNTTWETEKDTGRAPKMCKITMSFSPIHDISPGISSTGANRAPIYPIGDFLKSYNRKNDK